MSSPPNLRMMEADNKACGNCAHYGLQGKYDPAASRAGDGRRPICKKYQSQVETYEVCDSHQRRRS